MTAARTAPIILPGGKQATVDAGLAECLQALNDAGYASAQSCSGLACDHNGEGSCGYIAWFAADLSEAQQRAIIEAAQAAGLEERRLDLFFNPGLAVYASRLQDGTPEVELRGLANELACAEMGLDDIPTGEGFLPWLECRNGVLEELSAERGGVALRTDTEKAAAWDAFRRLLAV